MREALVTNAKVGRCGSPSPPAVTGSLLSLAAFAFRLAFGFLLLLGNVRILSISNFAFGWV